MINDDCISEKKKINLFTQHVIEPLQNAITAPLPWFSITFLCCSFTNWVVMSKVQLQLFTTTSLLMLSNPACTHANPTTTNTVLSMPKLKICQI